MPLLRMKPGDNIVRSLPVITEGNVNLRMRKVLTHGSDDGASAFDQLIKIVIRQVIRNHDDAINRAANDRIYKVLFAFQRMVRIGDHRVVLVGIRRILHRAHQWMVERVRDVGDHQGDHAGFLATQTAGMKVWLVFELLGCLQDTLARFLADGNWPVRLIEHA